MCAVKLISLCYVLNEKRKVSNKLHVITFVAFCINLYAVEFLAGVSLELQ